MLPATILFVCNRIGQYAFVYFVWISGLWLIKRFRLRSVGRDYFDIIRVGLFGG